MTGFLGKDLTKDGKIEQVLTRSHKRIRDSKVEKEPIGREQRETAQAISG